MNEKIELYLVSGFLGAGKTTFLQNVLANENNADRIGVIVNEFGSIGIDGKIIQTGDIKLVEINNGSIFCACLKDGFVKTLAAFLEQPIDKLYIEASGMAYPSNIEQLLSEIEPLVQKKYNTERRYNYKGCICIVDASHYSELSQSLVSMVAQIKKSNLIILNKIDTITNDTREKILHSISQLNPKATLYCTSYARVPDTVISESLCGETITDTVATSNTVQHRPYGAVLYLNNEYNYVSMVDFFQKISKKIYRIKGFFKTPNASFFVSGVGGDVTFTKTENTDSLKYQVVFIGNDSSDLTEWISKNWADITDEKIVLDVDTYQETVH